MELVVKFPASSGQLKSNEPLYLYFPSIFAIFLAAKYYDIVLFVEISCKAQSDGRSAN